MAKNILKVFDYACDKMYTVAYRENFKYQRVSGLLINYTGNGVIILGEKGLYHFKYDDIISVRPTTFKTVLSHSCEAYKNTIKDYLHITDEALGLKD